MQPLKINQEVEIIDSNSPYWKRRGQLDEMTNSSEKLMKNSSGIWIRFAGGRVVPFSESQIKKVKI